MKKTIIAGVCLMFALQIWAVQVTDFSMADAVLKEKKNDTEIWTKKDGTIITVYNNRSEAVFRDGSKVIKYKDGRREAISPDGKVVKVDEAKGIREYDAGSSKIVLDFKGKTPFGEPIQSVEKIINKTPRVRIIYQPDRSDEIIYPEQSGEKVQSEISTIFDGIYDKLRQKFINGVQDKKQYSGQQFDIQLSYCRYSKTGYCFGKARAVTVEIIENNSVMKSFILNGLDTVNKSKQDDFIKLIVDSINW
jgi:hypothetical protein